jgi:hypothetical protein
MSFSHGHAVGGRRSPTYNSWRAMRERCSSPLHPFWADYGGRGIVVDPRWSSFAVFLADVGERPAGMTLDRKDVDGDYEPGNVRWATRSQQRWNRRDMVERLQLQLVYGADSWDAVGRAARLQALSGVPVVSVSADWPF